MYRIDNILQVSALQREGLNNFSKTTKYRKDSSGRRVVIPEYEILTEIPKSFAEAAKLGYVSRQQAKEDNEGASDLASTLMTPPNELYTDIIPEEGYEVANQIDGMVTKQFIQRFYETYMVPVGSKDVYNRLGTISGNINDIHLLFPSGLQGIIGKDLRGSWRTNINYQFEVDEGLGTEPYVYTSLAFPPYISHKVVDVNEGYSEKTLTGSDEEEQKKNLIDSSFDMQNILYKRNVGSFRFPAFKQVNDNIKTLQLFLNRCFGIESTYMNEWDLSMYMQEGLMSYTELLGDDGVLQVPQYVTTLTYGLMDDAPVKELKDMAEKGDSALNVDLAQVESYASLNMAVSTRYGVDNEALGTPANEQMYEINKFPLSTYWYPFDDGNIKEDMNVSTFYDEMFSYRENGLAFNEDNPTGRPYTNKLFHGGDLSNSKQRFLKILNYYDNRRAVMSNWNSVDENGTKFFRDSDFTNKSIKSNAFSHTPFWKQLFSNPDDGMSDLDLYMQEIAATNGKDVSILNSGYQIMAKNSNSEFQDFCEERAKEDAERKMGRKFGEDEPFNMVIPKQYGDDNYSDMSFSLFKCKLKIPGSKLLNMFLNKGKSKSKAMSQVNAVSVSVNAPDGSNANKNKSKKNPGGALSGATPTVKSDETKIVYVDGKPQEVQEYTPEEDSDFASKKTVGDGVVENSPFLYGGPHGKFYSPLTVEGYCQINNENLATVPTMDSYSLYYGSNFNGIRGFEHTKNFKNSGTYADMITAITPNERNAVVTNDPAFGLKINANTERYVTYRSDTYYPKYVYQRNRYTWYYGYGYLCYWIDWRYYKRFKYTNGRLSRWIWWSTEFLESYYGTFQYQTRKEDNIPYQPDYTETDFRLIPVLDHFNQSYTNSEGEISWHMDHDDWKYAAADHKQNNWKHPCVKYMIVPSYMSANLTCGQAWLPNYERYDSYKHYASYYEAGRAWSNQIKAMYQNGVRNVWVTLPISNKASSEILSLVCGVARIEQSYALGWGWALKPHWGWGWHSRRHWCHRHCYRFRYKYYTWEWTLLYQPTYNIYFYPSMIKYNLPTNNLIQKEWKDNESARNKKSSNIIERYTLNDNNRFDHINDLWDYKSPTLFPFTKRFMNKYGRKESIMIPGWNYYGHYNFHSFPILHSRGFLWGNIAEEFATTGIVKKTTAVRPYVNTFPGKASYMDEVIAGRSTDGSGWWNWFRSLWPNGYTELKTNTINITFYSVSPFYKRTSWVNATKLTNLLKTCQRWPAIQRYQDNQGAHSVWYDPIDQYDVFYDTITQQIKWLEQFKQYAAAYLKDYLIYDVYKKSVDNHIQEVIEKEYNNSQYTSGWTDSYTEDIAYDDALAIVRRVFKTDDLEQNTLEELTGIRLKYLNSIKSAVYNLRNQFKSGDCSAATTKFMRLVTNVNAVLQGATTNGVPAETALFDTNYNYNVDYPTEFPINDSSTYDILKNPAAILWAYLNVLYHVRKYWVNLRFNKRSGSYWNLRGLERVITFLRADAAASDNVNSPVKNIPTGEKISLKKKKIQFVQPRNSFSDRVNSLDEPKTGLQMTNAVYVKVDYLSNPNPHSSKKWNNDTKLYDGLEIRYVDEVYKWAYKPQNGLYYVMSRTILNRISNYIDSLKEVATEIGTKIYVPTNNDIAALKVLTGKDYSVFEIDEVQTLDEYYATAKINNADTSKPGVALFTEFQNALMVQKRDYYNAKIKEILFPVYIKWEPEHVWTGLDEQDKSDSGWWIDENQKLITKGIEREVEDLYGLKHKKDNAISAGITFNVAASINPEVLLSDPDALKRSSLMEILCSTVNNMDLWRIQIPKTLDIPISLLKDEPTLIPAYQIDMAVQPFANKAPAASIKSVLAGMESGISPIQEAGKEMLTINTMSALGQLDTVSEINIPNA